MIANLIEFILTNCDDNVDVYIQIMFFNKQKQKNLKYKYFVIYYVVMLIHNLKFLFYIFAHNTVLEKNLDDFDVVITKLREINRIEKILKISINRKCEFNHLAFCDSVITVCKCDKMLFSLRKDYDIYN